MNVIIEKPINKLKKIGEIVSVAPGYARNFLIPKGFAVVANKHNIADVEKRKLDFEARQEQLHKEALELQQKFSDVVLTFISPAIDDGKLFGSIGTKQIAKALLEETGLKVRSDQLVLKEAINKLGLYKVELKLHADVSVTLTINIARNEIEANSQQQENAAQQKTSKTEPDEEDSPELVESN